MFRDLPINFNHDNLMEYLSSHPNLTLRSAIISNKILDENNRETKFLNGEKMIYVQTDFSPVFPKEATIGDVTCRIWHYTQKQNCKRCNGNGHRAYQTDLCDAYSPERPDTQIFWETSNPLSNFFICRIRIFGKLFNSSEQCYQWCKTRFIKRSDLAEKIMKCRTGKQVKTISNAIPQGELQGWDSQKDQVMNEILLAKINSSYRFKKALLDSGTRYLIEGTMDTYWGIGQSAHYCKTTHPDRRRGLNRLGEILMDIRFELVHGSQVTDVASNTSFSSDSEPEESPSNQTSCDMLPISDLMASTPLRDSTDHPPDIQPAHTSASSFTSTLSLSITSPDDVTAVPDCDISEVPKQNVASDSNHDVTASPDHDACATSDHDITVAPENDDNLLPTSEHSTSLLPNVVRLSIVENCSAALATSFANELKLDRNDDAEPDRNLDKTTKQTDVQPVPRKRRIISQCKIADPTKKKTLTKNDSTSKRGPMDSFLTSRRKLSPEKEADTDDSELKRTRSEDLNK